MCTTLFIECHMHCPAATSLTHTSSLSVTYQPKPLTFPESSHHLILRHTKIYGAASGSMAGSGDTKQNKTLSCTQRIWLSEGQSCKNNNWNTAGFGGESMAMLCEGRFELAIILLLYPPSKILPNHWSYTYRPKLVKATRLWLLYNNMNIYCLLPVGHCSRYFTCVNSFTPHNCWSWYHSAHLTNGPTEAQDSSCNLLRLYNYYLGWWH